MPPTRPAPGLIVALDGLTVLEARALAGCLPHSDCRLKVGAELFVKGGPQLVQELQQDGFEIFLDLKFHDIPNTVAAAVRAARELGVWMCTVHASGGTDMLEAAREAAAGGLHVVAVTVLTSLDAADLQRVGQDALPQQVVRLAQLAQHCGVSGIVCSPQEAETVRQECGEEFLIVTPGIRLIEQADDQKRVTTPAMAARAGADHLVIGRPIAQADDPAAALAAFLQARDAAD